MQAIGVAFGFLALCACAYDPARHAEGTVPDNKTAFLEADSKCHWIGRFAGVRYIDRARNIIAYDCIDPRNRVPVGSIDLREGVKTAARYERLPVRPPKISGR